MKNRIALLIATIALTSCGGGSEDTGASATRGVTDTSIVIGTQSDLSGILAVWGVPHVNGMRMRIDELNESGGVHGRTIEFVVEDSQYQVPLSVKAVNKLLNVDEVFAMLGAIGTPNNNATFERMFAANVPSLFPLTAAESMYEPWHPLKFSFFVSYQNQVLGGMRYMLEQHGFSKVCLQAPATDYGSEVAQGFEQAVEELGLVSVYTGRHKGTETDFVGTAASIKNSGCEMLLLGAFIKDTILVYTAVREAGWDGIVLANMVPYIPEIPVAADGGMNGFYAVSPFFVPYDDAIEADAWVADWYDRYRERYGTEPAPQSIIGYNSASLLILGLEAAGRDLTPEALVAGIESIENYDDPFGGPSVSFSKEKHVGSDALNLYQVQDQRWVTIAESIPY